MADGRRVARLTLTVELYDFDTPPFNGNQTRFCDISFNEEACQRGADVREYRAELWRELEAYMRAVEPDERGAGEA